VGAGRSFAAPRYRAIPPAQIAHGPTKLVLKASWNVPGLMYLPKAVAECRA
jgi:hypothetical protein